MRSRALLNGRHISWKRRRTSRLLALEQMEERPLLAPVVMVTTASDNPDLGTTLREAIDSADTTPDTTIEFGIQGSGPFVIQPLSALPAITNPTTILGSSQTGYLGTPIIAIDGSLIQGISTDGLQVSSGATGSMIEGLAIVNFTVGINVGASGTQVVGNYIGVDTTGTAAAANGTGIIVAASSVTIGGTASGDGNVISGNSGDGIDVTSSPDNVIAGNDIGTNAAGTGAVANGGDGVLISTQGMTVGPTVSVTGNLISGNKGDGVTIIGPFAPGVVIAGNMIGTDVTGTTELSNGGNGVTVQQADGTTIGGTTSADRNLITGNTLDGVFITNATNTIVEGNFIGLDVTGAKAPGNGGAGIEVFDASGNTIGGTAANAGNVIANNGNGGIDLETDGSVPTTSNLVMGNYIGTDSTGTLALGNGGNEDGGIEITDASDNTIGGTATGAGNLISGNTGAGIMIATDGLATPSDNVVQGNLIGTDVTGTKPLANGGDGIQVADGLSNTIGGMTTAAQNIISGNQADGVLVTSDGSAPASANIIMGNDIGTDSTGTINLGNGGNGVNITGGASGNTVGGTTVGGGNVIAFNKLAGVLVGTSLESTEDDDAILGNSIFSNGALGIDLGDDGVTMNTPGGPHMGPNHLQNYPVLSAASISGSGTTISGTLNSTPNSTFTVQFFASPVADASGYGEGEKYLGEIVVPTDSSGDGSFTNITVNAPPAGQDIITATATDPNGNTSEFSQAITAGSLVVTNTNDSGPGSLREAMLYANTLTGTPTITFAIGSDVPGALTIQPLTPLPVMTTPVVIDGTTQPGYTGTPLIVVNGTLAGAGADGLVLGPAAAGSTIEGLAVDGFAGAGIAVQSNNDLIVGNYIGVDATGSTAAANGTGILITASSDTVGGTTAGAQNVISGNSAAGIEVLGSGTTPATNTVIAGNVIGLAAVGNAAVANQHQGVLILDSSSNTVGGTAAAAANAIAGNAMAGVEIVSDGTLPAANNLVEGNFIGTNPADTPALGNALGVFVLDASNNTIGGTTPAARNVISGNSADGVRIQSDGTAPATANAVLANYIGTSISGAAALGNGAFGVDIIDASGNLIGGTGAGFGNVISANNQAGVTIGVDTATATATGNLLLGNFIGTNALGTAALPNTTDGVFIDLASGNTVGGTATGSLNVISGNHSSGVLIQGSGTIPATGNMVIGNFIGTTLAGTGALPNSAAGVTITDASGNTIGGTTAAARNVISGNTGDGILLGSDGAAPTSNNLVEGNDIGTDPTGTSYLSNEADGVGLNNAVANAIGGVGGAANVISGNAHAGVNIVSGSGNTLQGNLIGTNAAGTAPLGNSSGGVLVESSTGTLIGGTAAGAGNLIGGNLGFGVDVFGGASATTLQGNDIGTGLGGTGTLGNALGGVALLASNNTIGGTAAADQNIISDNNGPGVSIDGSDNLVAGNVLGIQAHNLTTAGNSGDGVTVTGSSNTIGGTAAGAGNLISGNGGDGVDVTLSATNNLVTGNTIGTDTTGAVALANVGNGVALAGANVTGNTVGGTAAGAGNLISGNTGAGIDISMSATGNLVVGNTIGTNTSGTAALGNGQSGVLIDDASGNTIGGTTAAALNLISGNSSSGVEIESDGIAPASNNLIEGNNIGTDTTGKLALGNGPSGAGVVILGASSNTIGGATTGAGNLIAGNSGPGVEIALTAGPDPDNNLIAGNLIGVNATDTASLANAIGVEIAAGSSNTVGGTTAAALNVIAGNTAQGVLIQGNSHIATASNLIEGNAIGTDAQGTAALANGAGVLIVDATDNTVGGTASGSLNVISGNTGAGVEISSDGMAAASGNLIAGNLIGTDVTGKLALGNGADGVLIVAASDNTVGGASASARNIISANTGNGVEVQGQGGSAAGDVVEGNYIGTDVTGLVGHDTNGKSLGNSGYGVVFNGASTTTVGGAASGEGNVISNNGQSGVDFAGDNSTDNNVLEGNLIGTDATGETALGNAGTGISLNNTFGNTIGGTTAGARNVIAGNGDEGIFAGFLGSTTNPALDVIEGNYIGTDAAGLKAVGNGLSGITLQDAAGITIGGTTPGAGNLISGNGNGTAPGISIAGTSQNNLVEGNLVGTDATGMAPLGGKLSDSNAQGIVIAGLDNTIGGTATGAGNTIAFNASQGIYLFLSSSNPATGNQIVGNTITSNGTDGITIQTPAGTVLTTLVASNVISDNMQNGLWIEGPSGNTVENNTISGNKNDGVKVSFGTGNTILTNAIFDNSNLSIELTSGGNNGQPAPVLTSATVSGGMTTIVGTLQAAPNTLYHLQFFSSPASAAPGFGEAETFLGEVMNVPTGSSGLANINVTLPLAVAADQYLTATATNQATGDTSQVSQTSPNLALTLTAMPEPVNQTQDLTYALTLANNGASPTLAITLTDTLPAGVTFVSATGGVTPVGGVLTFPAVDLDRGASSSYTIVVIADTAGTITNTATASYVNESDNPDIDPTKLTQTVTSTVNPVADLAVSTTADQTSVTQGADLTYTDTVVNNGPSSSLGVTVADTLPAGVTFVSASGGVTPVGNVLTFNLGTLAAGAMMSVTIVVQPPDIGTIVNTATVTSTTTDLNPANNTSSVSTSVVPSFIVTNTNNTGAGSLRNAILNANASTSTAPITILVEISGPGPYVIQPTTALPAITHPLTLDATSSAPASGTAPLVIDGSMIATGPLPGAVALTPGLLEVDAPDVVIRGVTLFGFDGFGIVLGSSSGDDTIAADNIGTNATGTAVTQGNTVGGVLVLSAGNTIGGTTAASTNVISGNAFGIYLEGSGATANVVVGNVIGTDRSGSTLLGDSATKVDGIEVDGASGNEIGLPSSNPGAAPGNVIGGYQVGIYLFDGAHGNAIQGNAIHANGISTANNSGQELGGILLASSNANTILDNNISGNSGSGIVLFSNAGDNYVEANNISGNTSTGVFLDQSSANIIGVIGGGNTIVSNGLSGVDIQGAGATSNLVQANTIQMNGQDGVYIFQASSNTIGGSTSGAGNLISNNGYSGVDLDASGLNVVQGNVIINHANGYGVLLENNAAQNTIGGSGSAANTFQNNALGNIQVLINGLPPSSNLSGNNTIGGNNSVPAGSALTTEKLKKHHRQHHHVKAVKHGTAPHPHGPRRHLQKPRRR